MVNSPVLQQVLEELLIVSDDWKLISGYSFGIRLSLMACLPLTRHRCGTLVLTLENPTILLI